jgi:hypothetical protein
MHHLAQTLIGQIGQTSCETLLPNPTIQARMIESPSRHTSWFHLFAYKRFHVLLNSLFKVLCNFPSRYLFAIGLAVIFSLTRSLPRALGCTFKQPDSIMRTVSASVSPCYGACTRYGSPCQGNLQGSTDTMHRFIHAASPIRC